MNCRCIFICYRYVYILLVRFNKLLKSNIDDFHKSCTHLLNIEFNVEVNLPAANN